MSGKFTRYPYVLASNIPTSANYSSTAYTMINIDVASVQVDYAGTSTAGTIGTFGIQGSCNYTQDVNGNASSATWANLPFLLGSSTVYSVGIPANPSPLIFDLYGSGVTAIRLQYQGASTGFFTAVVTGKRLGS